MSSATHKRVQVCIRVRPATSSSSSTTTTTTTSSSSSSSVVVNDQLQTVSVVTNAATGAGTCFRFDQVLDAHTDQAGAYHAAAAPIVDSVLRGYNGTVMAYGQTGAGKTFTMSGGRRHFEDRGICARAISSLFQQIQRKAAHAFVVRVSYIEVYNETLYDLLNFHESSSSSSSSSSSTSTTTRPNHPGAESLVIQENDKGQTFVRGLLRPIVTTEEQALDLLFQGETNRTIAEHCLNASSTRSHCIFTLYVERHANADAQSDVVDTDVGTGTVFSKLHLVDLAGSERMKKTLVRGAMLKEAAHINKSLTFLEQVVLALGDKTRQHVPYRQTPLTNLLKDSLGGNCRTMLVACVWPEPSHNDQTLATLKFATRMMRVKTSAIVNVARSGSGVAAETQAKLLQYTAEIQRLKDELAMHDTLSGRSLVAYDLASVSSASARAVYRSQINEFLRDQGKRPPVQSLTQVNELFSVFRELCLEGNQGSHVQPPPRSPAPPAAPPNESRMVQQLRALRGTPPQQQTQKDTERLPVLTKARTFSVTCEDSPQDDEDDDQSQTLPRIHPQSAVLEPTATTPRPQRSEKELFDAFKQLTNPTPESLLDLEVAKQNLRLAKAQTSTLGLELNKRKLLIDGLTLQLQDAESMQIGDRSDSDASAFVVRQLKDAKKQYREIFERFQEKKAEARYLLKIKDQMLQQVTREFAAWKANADSA